MPDNHIDKLISKLINTHGTNDPFKIARYLDIEVIDWPLNEVMGLYSKLIRQKFIFLNEDLALYERKFVCAHELGHALLHPDSNTPKLTRYSFRSELKVEREANYFGTNLLIKGNHQWELENPTNIDVLKYYGIPIEMERFMQIGEKK